MSLIAIAAVARNRVIGLAGDIPWSIPEDWRRFKAVTMGSNLIMGRVTFEAIGEPLPGRTSIVVSRRPGPVAPDAQTPTGHAGEILPTRVLWVTSLEEALGVADPDRPTFVAGGAEIYRLAWDKLTELDLTEVDQAPEGDTFFPEVDPAEWVEVSRDQREGFAFVRYRRR